MRGVAVYDLYGRCIAIADDRTLRFYGVFKDSGNEGLYNTPVGTFWWMKKAYTSIEGEACLRKFLVGHMMVESFFERNGVIDMRRVWAPMPEQKETIGQPT